MAPEPPWAIEPPLPGLVPPVLLEAPGGRALWPQAADIKNEKSPALRSR
jgi:hypothetical protein